MDAPADFRLLRQGEGYDLEEVDRFLGRLADALGHEPPSMSPEQVLAERFTPVSGRAAYAMDDVDRFRQRAAEELRRRRNHAAEAVPWELRSARPARPAPHPGGHEPRSSYPVWVRAAAVVALVALLGLALAQVL
jgi:hypothetical protein